MKHHHMARMSEATRLTREGKLAEALAVIQGAGPPPALSTLPTLPALSTLPALPALPALSTLSTLQALSTLPTLPTLPAAVIARAAGVALSDVPSFPTVARPFAVPVPGGTAALPSGTDRFAAV